MYIVYVYINTDIYIYIYLVYISPLYGLRGDRSETAACRTVMYQLHIELFCSHTIPTLTHTSYCPALAPSF